MALKLMYITNKPEIAKIAEDAGVDWIFIDMEFIGKDQRQKGLDTVKNRHTTDDIRKIKNILKKSEVLVRVNPIHEDTNGYPSSDVEINSAIKAGADIIMLPYFKTVEEVRKFILYVGKRAKTCLLLETKEAVAVIDDILEIDGIDMIHIGLNDLHLALHMKFMFQLLADGTVEYLGNKIKSAGIPFGFGGIAKLDSGILPGAMVLKEHYRLGSSMVIVGRSFCDSEKITNLQTIEQIFKDGINQIRTLENDFAKCDAEYFQENKRLVKECVNKIVSI